MAAGAHGLKDQPLAGMAQAVRCLDCGKVHKLVGGREAPISHRRHNAVRQKKLGARDHSASQTALVHRKMPSDRKSTRLNSSHLVISYAVFCLKKKKNNTINGSPV